MAISSLNAENRTPLLRIENFSLSFAPNKPRLIDMISFSLYPGEILGIVGESGCGKSLTALSIMNLHPKGMFQLQGKICFQEKNLLGLSNQEMISLRGSEISMIFQEPMTSLNPVHTIEKQLVEMILLHQNISRKEAKEKALNGLKQVFIPAAEEMIKSYPHQLSGGMRQRVMIAMAVANQPQLLIADEPTTALDVTIQAQILNLILELQNKTTAGILFITHDLGVIAEICERVIIMYAGKIVEEMTVEELFNNPRHPYTLGLLQSLPRLDKKTSRLDALPGHVLPPHLYQENACRFYGRCRKAQDICRKSSPKEQAISPGHKICCHLWT